MTVVEPGCRCPTRGAGVLDQAVLDAQAGGVEVTNA